MAHVVAIFKRRRFPNDEQTVEIRDLCVLDFGRIRDAATREGVPVDWVRVASWIREQEMPPLRLPIRGNRPLRVG